MNGALFKNRRPLLLAVHAFALSLIVTARPAQAADNDFFIFPSVRVGGSGAVGRAALPRMELQWTLPFGYFFYPDGRSSQFSPRQWFAGISLDLSYAHTVGSGEQRDMWGIGAGFGTRWWIGGEVFANGLVGTLSGAGAYGFRAGLRLTGVYGLVGTEVSYDTFGSSMRSSQEARLFVFVDFAVAFMGIVTLTNE